MTGFTGVGPMYFTWPTIVPVPPWAAIGVDVAPNATSVTAPAAMKEKSACFISSLLLVCVLSLRRRRWLRRCCGSGPRRDGWLGLRTGLRLPGAPDLGVVLVRIVV